jgi:hypothetical protein
MYERPESQTPSWRRPIDDVAQQVSALQTLQKLKAILPNLPSGGFRDRVQELIEDLVKNGPPELLKKPDEPLPISSPEPSKEVYTSKGDKRWDDYEYCMRAKRRRVALIIIVALTTTVFVVWKAIH